MAKSKLTFENSLESMRKKLVSGRNAIQAHLINVGILAVQHNNLEGYIEKTINCLDEHGQHTYAEAALIWVEKWYGYTADDNGKQAEWKGADFIRDNFTKAKQEKFWTLAKPKKSSFKGYNFEDAIIGQLEQANKMLKRVAEGKLSEDDAAQVVVDIDQMRRVRAALKAA